MIHVRLSFCTVGLRVLDLRVTARSFGKCLVDLKRANMHFHVGGFEIRDVARLTSDCNFILKIRSIEIAIKLKS